MTSFIQSPFQRSCDSKTALRSCLVRAVVSLEGIGLSILSLPARGRYGAPLRCTMATSGQSERCFSTSGKVTKLRCQTWMKHASGEAKTRSKMKRKWSKILVPIFYLWILVQYCDRRIIVLRCCVHFGVIERDYSG